MFFYCVLRRHRLNHELHSSPPKVVRRPTDSFPPARRPKEGTHTNIPPIRSLSSQQHHESGSQTPAIGESFELTSLPTKYSEDPVTTIDQQQLLRPSLPPGLESWERRGVEQASIAATAGLGATAQQGQGKSVRFSGAHSSTSKKSGSAGRAAAGGGSGAVSGSYSTSTTTAGSSSLPFPLPRTSGLPIFQEIEYRSTEATKKSPSKSPRDSG